MSNKKNQKAISDDLLDGVTGGFSVRRPLVIDLEKNKHQFRQLSEDAITGAADQAGHPSAGVNESTDPAK